MKPAPYYSPKDEAAFFGWLQSISGVISQAGRGLKLSLSFLGCLSYAVTFNWNQTVTDEAICPVQLKFFVGFIFADIFIFPAVKKVWSRGYDKYDKCYCWSWNYNLSIGCSCTNIKWYIYVYKLY